MLIERWMYWLLLLLLFVLLLACSWPPPTPHPEAWLHALGV